MLRVSDLTDKEINRARENHQTYKDLYTKCTEHIKWRNSLGHTVTRFHVPGFVVGRPLFNHAHAVRYIKEKLERGNFDVSHRGTAEIVIDWTKQKNDVIRKQAPKKAKDVTPKPARSSSPSRQTTTRKKIEEPLHVRLARLNHNLKMARGR